MTLEDAIYIVDPNATERSRKRKKFRVPYRIEGVLEIEAEDAFEATRIAERQDEFTLAFHGEIEMSDPEPAS